VLFVVRYLRELQILVCSVRSFVMARLLKSQQSFWKPMEAAAQQLRVKSSIASAVGTSEHLADLDVPPRSAFSLPFARAKIGPFFQEQPRLGSQFAEDTTLQNYLKRHMPAQVNTYISRRTITYKEPRSVSYSWQ